MSQSSAPRRGAGRLAGERPNTRGDATRSLILVAAERLFAERGIEAVPLRDIGIEAGQRNHAVVQYHFGDRMALVQAILEARGAESEAQRTSLVADLALGRQQVEIRDLIAAFVWPLALHIEQDNYYLAFLSRYITEEGGYDGLADRAAQTGSTVIHSGASVTTLRTLLSRLAPEVPDAVLSERWWVTLTSAVHALARYQSARRKRERLPAPLEVLLEDLINYLSAGIVAAIPAHDPRA